MLFQFHKETCSNSLIKGHLLIYCRMSSSSFCYKKSWENQIVNRIVSWVNRCIPTINTRAALHHSFFLSASGGAGGVRTVITRQHELILRAVYPHADVELRAVLSEQLVTLLDSLLSGYVAQLTSLRRAGQQDRYVTLENEYTQKRSELLTPLCEFTLVFCDWALLCVSQMVSSCLCGQNKEQIMCLIYLCCPVIVAVELGQHQWVCGAGGEILWLWHIGAVVRADRITRVDYSSTWSNSLISNKPTAPTTLKCQHKPYTLSFKSLGSV